MSTPASPTRTAARLNQAIVDLTGDEYFRTHPFFHPDTITDIGVFVSDPIRLAEVLEDAVRRASDARPAKAEIPGQLQFDFTDPYA